MSIEPQMEASWLCKLREEFEKPYMKRLQDFLTKEMQEAKVYPPVQDIFRAFCHASFLSTNVVIVGQDPYHGPGQAHGLSFSVPSGTPYPPSLQNIFKELESDLNVAIPRKGSLLSWAKQGVLLLNATLTVRENEPKSHYGRGWEIFTNRVLDVLAERPDPIVFVLWGKAAQETGQNALGERKNKHLVLSAPHPSPFSAHSGFFGCRHFSQINAFLRKNNKKEIDWKIED